MRKIKQKPYGVIKAAMTGMLVTAGFIFACTAMAGVVIAGIYVYSIYGMYLGHAYLIGVVGVLSGVVSWISRW